MLIYEKKVDGVRHLFGTLSNLPSDEDLQLTYKDREGNEVEDITIYNFFYNDLEKCVSAGLSRRQLVDVANDLKLNIWLGDILVIGVQEEESEDEPEEPENPENPEKEPEEPKEPEDEPVTPVEENSKPFVPNEDGVYSIIVEDQNPPDTKYFYEVNGVIDAKCVRKGETIHIQIDSTNPINHVDSLYIVNKGTTAEKHIGLAFSIFNDSLTADTEFEVTDEGDIYICLMVDTSSNDYTESIVEEEVKETKPE